MKRRSVRLAPAAERDLEALTDWLTEVASEDSALRYIRRVYERLETLADGSERGTIQNERTGLRVIGILKSVSVAFSVGQDTVDVQRVLYGGQNWKTVLTDRSDTD